MELDVLGLSRFQFASTSIFHFFFVSLTVGLAFLIAVMETFAYVRKDRARLYGNMTNFFGHLFLINFAVGVVTGIVQEFQFGMNWSEYSRFVGNIFGVPLALEVLMAFFLESTFIALWWFGKDRLPPWARLGSIWLVAIGTQISAFWIVLANAWMHHPVGYRVVGEQAFLTSFPAVVFNYKAWLYFAHVQGSAWTVAAFFVLGISAYHLLRRQNVDVFSRSLRIGLVFAATGTVFSISSGHREAQVARYDQPMKFAAMEAQWQTSESPAPWSAIASINMAERRNDFSVEIPYLGSLLAYNSLHGNYQGIIPLQQQYERTLGPGNYIPPVPWVYWNFRIMVGIGTLLLLAAYGGLFLWWRQREALNGTRWYLRVLLLLIPLPWVANFCGWITTEMGRQPFMVYGLLTVQEGVSANTTAEVLVGLIGLWVVYLALIGLDIYLLTVTARAGIHDKPEAQILAAPAPSYTGEGFQGYERRD
ncbi:cytochrome ubiquinol oxidase subunit I (plasmid) [Deinococcus metallilatus]|uniref:Cytochrome d ubiquinol oxidase subunit I n=1 Tax=Deinococcus metallilatus TaxID=1211322 RepID=A0ABR6MZZ4_9DEIO|nr:cytochrome ubiquinol oxidase subunit I [Deinococcus metallilatus]MBB5296935.1 cytochrome d ubiquinol oxidase subunit I [Deinococcus metallilatus]QBY06697.1 cytochrome ubiquinol oxidase subunit I [Deinococcus metallilatus]GMA15166.1 cytochrome ubiquinol oxidase subunit I [Deinococcus metallilatus]